MFLASMQTENECEKKPWEEKIEQREHAHIRESSQRATGKAFCCGVTADSKPDDAPEISSVSQSFSVLGLIAEVFSSSRERLVLTKTLKMSKNYSSVLSI